MHLTVVSISCLTAVSQALWISLQQPQLRLAPCMLKLTKYSARVTVLTSIFMARSSAYQNVFISYTDALRVRDCMPPSNTSAPLSLPILMQSLDQPWQQNHSLEPCSPIVPDQLQQILQGHPDSAFLVNGFWNSFKIPHVQVHLPVVSRNHLS